ncbi:Poly(A)-specific ribonuclease [Purpureocillium takamizusanense]|uniref:Poly(A)-specific ribonuclease n=1 Tax=Purpureocillium takamizusanense TaxID=2060973 RepID=A0A9Q8Q601_9HYPO|nr:Poly(A)-specific ribonuclease [Purpureocillium takamizusanense]UNI14288.1 Poly(A)-specific ribonuclease [Purpureocillium takamizusanense]
MDVTARSFWQLLPSMLEAICAADYVAVDLEMSGIMTRDSLTTGEMSLEQAYARLRNAANTFSPVALGVTTVRFVESSYQAQTFTIPISTLVPCHTREDTQLASLLDRKLTFSSNSLRFLEVHGFDVNCAIGSGVPYLSREEMEILSERFLCSGGTTGDLIEESSLTPFDRSFCDHVGKTVRKWLASEPKLKSVLEIPEPRGGNLRRSTTSLVRQVVASEFPQCRCWRQHTGDAMSVVLRDEKKEYEIEQRETEAKVTSLAKNFGEWHEITTTAPADMYRSVMDLRGTDRL